MENVLQFIPGDKRKADAERQALQAQLHEAAERISAEVLSLVKHAINEQPELMLKSGPGIPFLAALGAVLGIDLLSALKSAAKASQSPGKDNN